MKPTAGIANTSRGEAIDENALTRMLRAGEIAGAGLDVFELGHRINPRFREMPKVALLPHMGSANMEGRIKQGEKALINIKTFADGHSPPDLVFPAKLQVFRKGRRGERERNRLVPAQLRVTGIPALKCRSARTLFISRIRKTRKRSPMDKGMDLRQA